MYLDYIRLNYFINVIFTDLSHTYIFKHGTECNVSSIVDLESIVDLFFSKRKKSLVDLERQVWNIPSFIPLEDR